jgi:hypothetical protein
MSPAKLGPMQLGQAVDRDIQEFGVRMLEAVPARVVGRIAEAEVGAEVDDRDSLGGHRRDQRGGGAVGQGQERGIDVVGQLRADGQAGARELRMEVADRVVVAVAAGQADDVHVGVAAQQADELCADVAGRPDDPDSQLAGAAIGRLAAARAREEPGRRPVRLDHGGRLQSRAHRREPAPRGAVPFTDG